MLAQMTDRTSPKAAQGEATRQRTIAQAREFFALYGYARTSIEELVRKLELTRGALYHHFPSKDQLFAAVLEAVQEDVACRIAFAVDAVGDPRQKVLVGCQAFLQAALDPQVQQIMLIDGPAVIGWNAWREIDARHGARSLREGLSILSKNGLLRVDSEAAAHLLSGALNEAALWVSGAADPEKAIEAASQGVGKIVAGLLA
jgi:AcrR family transcriptional regulator